MAVLDGWIAASPAGGYVNSHLTPALHEYETDYWPVHAAHVSGAQVGALVTHWPVATAPRAIAGWRAPGFADDWYHRIHLRPARIDLGNVVTEQAFELEVWNAHLVPRTLDDIAGVPEGVELQGPDDLPMVFGALQSATWLVSVARDGPPRIDATVHWLFEGIAAPRLRITGTRVVAWAFAPDWSDGIVERLAWRTEILGSESGCEQRRALRDVPRRAFEMRFLVDGRERALLDAMLAGWGGRVWALPIWPDAQRIAAPVADAATAIACSTAGRDFRAGGLAVLLGLAPFDAETVELLEVQPGELVLKRPTQQAWPAFTTVLAPVRTAELSEQPRLLRLTDRAAAVDATFRVAERCDWPAALPATLYRGAAVVADRPEESEDLTGTWQRLQLELDNASALPVRTDTAGLGFAVLGHRWMLGGRAEHSAWRSLMYALRGRQAAAWRPTHSEDLTLVAETGAAGTTIDVQAIGYSRFLAGRPGRRDVRIELSDGSAVHRRITGAVELSATVERLALDAAPGVTLRPPGSTGIVVTRISWLQLMRLDHDEVELHHVTDGDGVAAAHAVFRTVRDDLELA